jgi:hypothetical protein
LFSNLLNISLFSFDFDVSLLLEHIPCSEPEDADRLLEICKNLAKKRTDKSKIESAFIFCSIFYFIVSESTPALRLTAEKMKKSKARFSNKNQTTPDVSSDLVAAIQNKRGGVGSSDNFLENLLEKYGGENKKKRSKKT